MTPEINSVLQELLLGARSILADHFVGMYLDGSLAIGGFEPDKSDLDSVVVTASDVSSDTFGFTRLTGGLNVTLPSSSATLPPGYHMLFVVRSGVPSVAGIVLLS